MDAAEPAVADDQAEAAGGGVPVSRRRRRNWGWFARLSVGASILTTVLALVFALWLQRAAQTDSTAGGTGTEQSIRSTTTTAATVPKGEVYIVYDFRSRTTSRAEQAAAVSLTESGLSRAGIPGVQVECLGGFVLVVVSDSDRDRLDAVAGIISEQGLLLPQSISETPPDTTGNLVGCE